MVETFRSWRYKVIKECLDWIEIESRITNWRQWWYIKWTNKKAVSLVPKESRYLEFMYRLFKGYQQKYWNTFKINKNEKFTVEAWGNRRKTRVYLMDKNDKVIMQFPSITTLKSIAVSSESLDTVYSKIKKDYCPKLSYIVEEDYYGNQYEVLID